MAVILASENWLIRGMIASPELSQRPDAPGSVAFNLAGLALLVVLLAVGLAYGIDRAARSGVHAEARLDDAATVTQTVGGRELTIPSSWFRYGEQIKGGFASQVDLNFFLDLGIGSRHTRVDVALVPQSRARASAALLDRVYLHQFGENVSKGFPGLVGKSLESEDGYQNETVWYDALSATPFVTKCATSVGGNRPETCLRTIHLQSGLAAILQFDASALGAWQKFDGELALWLGQIGAL
jgi:hypothetical protein